MIIQGTNIRMVRGDTEALKVRVEGDEGEQIKLVTGDTVYFTVKQNAMAEQKILQKVVKTFPLGEAFISIYPEDTKNLQPTSYVYDIQLTRANGQVKTIIPKSGFIIEEDVTHE